MLKMELPTEGKKEDYKGGFIDLMKEDMKRIGVTEEDKKKVK